ncbi:hypothetical protein MTO96_041372 [Rhipicephalus appendiculatus]
MEPVQGVTTSQRPMARPSRRVRFMLPNGCVVCPRRVELASRDTVILATGADTTGKRAAPEPSSEPATLKRYVYRGGDSSSPEHQLDLRPLGIDSSPDKAETSQALSENDGFMEEILAMYRD